MPAVRPHTAHIVWSARTSYINCGGGFGLRLGNARITVRQRWHILPARQNSPPLPLASTFEDTVNKVWKAPLRIEEKINVIY